MSEIRSGTLLSPHCLLSIYFSTLGSVLLNSFLPFEMAREGVENVKAAKWKRCASSRKWKTTKERQTAW